MEFELKTDLTKELPAQIDFNYEAIKADLDAKLERYRNLAITDADIPEAKKDRAALNNLVKALDEERKRVKKTYLEPYAAFESRINELMAMVKGPSDEIDEKVKHYEESKKDEKREAIKRFYRDNIGSLADILPLERIYDKRWENVTCKLMTATQEIMAKLEQVKKDLTVISDLKGKYELPVKSKYIETLSLSAALSENKRLEDLDRQLEEVKAAQAKQTQTAQDAPNQPQEAIPERTATNTNTEPQSPPETAGEPAEGIRESEEYYTIDFRLWATKKQLAELREFLLTHNIKYGKIPDNERKVG